MRRLSTLREEVETWATLQRRAADALELAGMTSAEEDGAMATELETEAADIQATLGRLEFRLRMSGEHDRDDALLSVHAGAGGTESQDWAAMLLRMYARWAETRGYKTEIVDLTEGEEAGMKSATMLVEGAYAYGYLRAERGVHRLVRMSPFDSAHRRHTSFALVEVMPNLDDDIETGHRPG